MVLASSAPAIAGELDTPDCRRDLAVAGQLISEIAAREDSVKPGDWAGYCALLRRNLPEMVKARDAMDRCLMGHAHGENVGQMDASIEDIRDRLGAKCGGIPSAAASSAPPAAPDAPIAQHFDIPPVGTVWTYAATTRAASPDKPTTNLDYQQARRVSEAGPDWFRLEYETRFPEDKKLRSVERHSGDPFAPPLTSETVLLTAQGEPVIAGASLKLNERSDGGVIGSLFPLALGKTAQYRFVNVDSTTGAAAAGVKNCTVESRGPVVVPKGTYDAFAVRCKTTTYSAGHQIQVDSEGVYHYADGIGSVIGYEGHVLVSKLAVEKPLGETWTTTKLVKIDKPS